MEYLELIENYIETEIRVLQQLDREEINKALILLDETRIAGGNTYIFGNGGSSATASHFQNDFNKGISEYIEKKFNFVCLNDNVPTIMAIANDIGFEQVFEFQLRNKLKPGDILMAISGSGNSKNIINAVEYGKKHHCKVIGLTGFDGGQLKELSDVSLHADIESMQITEDIHMIFDHLMMSIFYKTLVKKSSN